LLTRRRACGTLIVANMCDKLCSEHQIQYRRTMKEKANAARS
jgi:hypothetical protein